MLAWNGYLQDVNNGRPVLREDQDLLEGADRGWINVTEKQLISREAGFHSGGLPQGRAAPQTRNLSEQDVLFHRTHVTAREQLQRVCRAMVDPLLSRLSKMLNESLSAKTGQCISSHQCVMRL